MSVASMIASASSCQRGDAVPARVVGGQRAVAPHHRDERRVARLVETRTALDLGHVAAADHAPANGSLASVSARARLRRPCSPPRVPSASGTRRSRRRRRDCARRRAPRRCSFSTTSRTSTSGADAPAVTPTRAAPAIHSGRSSSARSTMYAATPRFAATSRSRFEFELFGLPTTITTSHLRRQELDRVLAVLRRIADVVLLRADDLREARASARRRSRASSTDSVVCVT